MSITTAPYSYRSFGLRIDSEIPLPELPPLKHTEGLVPVSIKKTDLTHTWVELDLQGSHFYIQSNQVMFCVPHTAIFLVQDGVSISVSSMPDADENKIRLFILGSCMGVLLMQRKILPLHGSAIAIDGKAYAIVGQSGAGKSTLSSVLLSQGYKLLSDDLIPVVLDEHNKPMIMPAYPQQKLWQESMNELGIDKKDGQPLFERDTKFAIKIHSQFHEAPLPLAGVFELITTEDHATIRPIQGMERFQMLLKHTYRSFLIQRIGLLDWHFQTLARFVNQIAIYELARPITGFTSPLLASFLLNTINNEETHRE